MIKNPLNPWVPPQRNTEDEILQQPATSFANYCFIFFEESTSKPKYARKNQTISMSQNFMKMPLYLVYNTVEAI